MSRAMLKKIGTLDFLKKSDLKQIGKLVIEQIFDRTTKGIGAKDNKQVRFKAYKKWYGDKRSKSGLSRSPVDLFFTGHMLSNLKLKEINTDRNTFTVAVDDDDMGKWKGAHEGVKRKDGKVKRPFLDLSQGDKTKLKKPVDKIIRRAFKSSDKKPKI